MNTSEVKRNILLNPGPGTTTDTVKYAQVVPDICPREREFGDLMEEIGRDLVRVVHGDPSEYASVLFCGSGTINIDACVSSLVPQDRKILIVSNGVYSKRAAEACMAYGIEYMTLDLPTTCPADPSLIQNALEAHPEVAVVYSCHHETVSGILNPMREIGVLAHQYGAIHVVDTTSTYAMIPIDVNTDQVDVLMASAQKGLMAMTGLSFVIGKTSLFEQSRNYPVRSFYTNIYMQYSSMKKKKEMRFTPPVQTVYALRQALIEYWREGEAPKWDRHQRVWRAICEGVDVLGFRTPIQREDQSRLVLSIDYPKDPHWDFTQIHDYCFERGFTIYPGNISGNPAFRLCAYGAIDEADIHEFFRVFKAALDHFGVSVPVH
ncbi:MAG: 2-aminoethylphosphonate aminotransferase [Clostridiaceae bacterium]|nr:2-aminoethylphosphonate aminotransferase [Clostridiaceae bacterium]